MKYKAAKTNLANIDVSKLDALLEKTQFDGVEPTPKKVEQVKEFLTKEENSERKDFVIYCYERSMVLMCKFSDIWIKYLYFLERDSTTDHKIDEICSKYEKLLSKIDTTQGVLQQYADYKEKQKSF